MSVPQGPWTRRDLLRLAVAAPWLGSAGCARSGEPLVIGTVPWGSFQFMEIAAEEGWLPSGVRLQRQRTSFDMLHGLREGSVDAATISLDLTLQLVAEGLDLVIVLITDISAGADVVMARPDIATLTELRGKRIGYEANALGHLMLAKLLEAARLQPSDVRAVPMDTDHMTSWFTLQPLDAVITYEPSLRRFEELGLVRLFDSRALPQTIIDVLAVRREAATHRRREVEDAVAGHFRALARWQTNPIDTAHRLAPLIDVPVERVDDAFRGVDLPDVRSNRKLLAPPAEELHRAAHEIVAILQRAGLMQSAPAFEGLFDASFLPRSD